MPTPMGMRTARRQSTRRGVALMIVLVAIAVIMVIATAVTATLSKDFDRILIAADGLYRLKTEIIGVNPSFFERIQTYPGNLHHLVEPIKVTEQNSCRQLYKSSPDVSNWQGPYHLFPFNPALGYTLASGINASDTVGRSGLGNPVVPAFTNGAAALVIIMKNMQRADADALKSRIDGTAGDTIAIIGSGENVTVHYRMPRGGNC